MIYTPTRRPKLWSISTLGSRRAMSPSRNKQIDPCIYMPHLTTTTTSPQQPRRSKRISETVPKTLPETRSVTGIEDSPVPSNEIKCQYCDECFKSPLLLTRHKTNMHRDAVLAEKCENCGVTRAQFKSKQTFERHLVTCCAKGDVPRLNRQPRLIDLVDYRLHQSSMQEAYRSKHSTAEPLQSQSVMDDAVPDHNKQSPEEPHSGRCELENKYIPTEHTSDPVPPYAKKAALLLPKVNDAREWKELDGTICDRLKGVWSKLSKVESEDTLMLRFEEIVHHTISECCGVHEPKEQSHPRRSKPDRPGRQEKKLQEQRKKLRKEVRRLKSEGQTEHQVRQASRQLNYVLGKIKDVKKAREMKTSTKKQAVEQAKFKKEPWKYAKELFNPPSAGQPTFSTETAADYFSKLYCDKSRSEVYQALPGWVRPPKPTKLQFNLQPPTLEQLQDAVKKKRNKNAPGINSIPFLVYKKCPKLLEYLLQIFERVWTSGKIPKSWQCAIVTLISKSSCLDDPGEFRPIALLNAEGRLFFTLMQWRLSDYMVENGYIKSRIQKGFMKDVAGCIEHSETMYQMLRDAKDSRNSACVCWIDLANAYGSVKHSLFQFALEWYHVPDHFCGIIHAYYEGLMAAIMVGSDVTPWFRFSIGVFQGCTASTILFNVAFNTCFAHLEQHREECGYQFKSAPVTLLTTGYADDLGIATRPTKGVTATANNQRVVDSLNEWLSWSKTMKAKPKKCVAMALEKGKAVEPGLTIKSDGKVEPMARISDEIYAGKSRDPWFKFLGRYLDEELTENKAKELLVELVTKASKIIGDSPLRGSQKVWIWDSYVMAKIGWLLLIHDVPPTFVKKELVPIQLKFLKRWSGLHSKANVSIFFRDKAHHGLQLKEMCSWHKQNRLIRRSILSSSSDPQVRAIHNSLSERQHRSVKGMPGDCWNDCVELESLKQSVVFELMRGPMKTDGDLRGLGYAGKRPQATAEKEERQAILGVFKECQEEARIVEVMTNLEYFGEWVKWDAALQLDKSWHNLLAYESDSQLSFLLNATEDMLPTPSNRCRQKLQIGNMCPLGCDKVGSLVHILCGCCKGEEKVNVTEGYSEGQWRVTWRHDSVLLAIHKAVLKVTNQSKNTQCQEKRGHQPDPPTALKFKDAKGDSYKHSVARAPVVKGLIGKALDWKIKFDLGEGKTLFPAEILETNGGKGTRPDGVIWSMSTKVVVWIELTSPWEENMTKWHFEKKAKYNQLKIDCEAKGWEVHPLCVEVGCRGYVAESFPRMCKVLGFGKQEEKSLKLAVEKTARHCSHTIFCSRFLKHWEPRPPVDVSTWSEAV